jgi:hypothetical protein
MRAHSTMIVPQAEARTDWRQLLLLGLGMQGSLERAEQQLEVQKEQDMQQQGRGRRRQAGRVGKKKPPADLLVLDLPWLVHWPKFVLWCMFQGCHLALASVESTAGEGALADHVLFCRLQRQLLVICLHCKSLCVVVKWQQTSSA